MTSVSIIIPTLFPLKRLTTHAARLASFKPVTEVIVVVNGTGEKHAENFVHWQYLGKNKGFTGACNAGARAARGDMLLFLNDDCELTEEAIQKMVEFMESNPGIVGTQPVVRRQNKVQSTEYQDMNTVQNTIDAKGGVENIGFWVDTTIGKAFPVTEQAEMKHSSSQQKVYGLSGTCLLIRKEVFEKVGMWDESFHSYLEDVDLAIRLHKLGHRVMPCLDAEAVHAHMTTSSRMGLYKPTQDVKNWWRLVVKHPDIFPLSFPLLLERVRNVSGLVKAWFTSR
ncbi:MAG TPA: glycosyltransferase family 2 protein [Candidatus Woesebacteria bacterium]|nr:glycosyltransferase family 2 protein [Candidatus Woesebacteria bacterium]